MEDLLPEISRDLSAYLDINQSISLSLVSTSTFFGFLNDIKYDRYIPSNDIKLLKDLRKIDVSYNNKLKYIKSTSDVNIHPHLLSHVIVYHTNLLNSINALEIPKEYSLKAVIKEVEHDFANIIIVLFGAGMSYNNNKRSYFTTLVQHNLENIIKILIDFGVDINMGEDKNELLYKAMNNKNLDLFNYLIDNGLNITDGYSSALYGAIQSGYIEGIKMLFNSGVDINGRFGQYRDTGIMISVKNKNKEMLMTFINARGDPNVGNHFRQTPIFEAVKNNDIEIVNILVDVGANVETAYAIINAIEGNKQKIMKILMRGEINLNNPQYLNAAINKKNREMVEILLDRGFDINYKNEIYNAPIFSAYRDLELMKYLISKGADINSTNDSDQTLLHLFDNFEIAKYLVDSGINIEMKNDRGETPIFNALRFELNKTNPESENINDTPLLLLINSKANLNSQNKDGDTILHIALRALRHLKRRGDYLSKQSSKFNYLIQIITAIIDAGANYDISNNNGDTQIVLAIHIDDIILSKMIGMAENINDFNPINVNIKNAEGNTPLHLIILQLYTEKWAFHLFKYIFSLEYSGKIEGDIRDSLLTTNNDGDTVLDLAKKNGYDGLYKYLTSKLEY